MARLFWNPRQDVWGLVRDFSDGYGSKAGASLSTHPRCPSLAGCSIR